MLSTHTTKYSSRQSIHSFPQHYCHSFIFPECCPLVQRNIPQGRAFIHQHYFHSCFQNTFHSYTEIFLKAEHSSLSITVIHSYFLKSIEKGLIQKRKHSYVVAASWGTKLNQFHPPNRQRRPLPYLLYLSFFYH